MMATLPCCANEVNRWQRLQGAGRRAHLKYAISFMLLAAAITGPGRLGAGFRIFGCRRVRCPIR